MENDEVTDALKKQQIDRLKEQTCELDNILYSCLELFETPNPSIQTLEPILIELRHYLKTSKMLINLLVQITANYNSIQHPQ
mgnify:CR=1 FL=1